MKKKKLRSSTEKRKGEKKDTQDTKDENTSKTQTMSQYQKIILMPLLRDSELPLYIFDASL